MKKSNGLNVDECAVNQEVCNLWERMEKQEEVHTKDISMWVKEDQLTKTNMWFEEGEEKVGRATLKKFREPFILSHNRQCRRYVFLLGDHSLRNTLISHGKVTMWKMKRRKDGVLLHQMYWMCALNNVWKAWHSGWHITYIRWCK